MIKLPKTIQKILPVSLHKLSQDYTCKAEESLDLAAHAVDQVLAKGPLHDQQGKHKLSRGIRNLNQTEHIREMFSKHKLSTAISETNQCI